MNKLYDTYLIIVAIAVIALSIDLWFPFLGPCQYFCKLLFGSCIALVHLKPIVCFIAPKFLKIY